MKFWEKVKINLSSGEIVEAQAPIIISASRATDIPAFYTDWLVERVKKGFVKWKNPFNNKWLYVSFSKARLFVFWSKNHAPLLPHLDFFDKQNLNYYFQFTINDYEKFGLENGVPSLKTRIETFKEISRRVGKGRIVWRFDPLILTKQISTQTLSDSITKIADELASYTQKLVFSFADISSYRKVASNLKAVPYIEFNEPLMHEMAERIGVIAKERGLAAATCSEKIDLEKYGIAHNKCVDDELMIREFSHDKELMSFLGYEPNLFGDSELPNLKDKGQREECGCIMSKDIGQYNTCPHQCLYCYANTSPKIAIENFKTHQQNPHGESILGE